MYSTQHLSRLATLETLVPDTMSAFQAFDRAALAPGVLPAKTKELIAVAVALTTQCPYCLEIHSAKAREAGATETELAEAAMVAAALRAGAAVTHATHILKNS